VTTGLKLHDVPLWIANVAPCHDHAGTDTGLNDLADARTPGGEKLLPRFLDRRHGERDMSKARPIHD
jgi:hypothetical protein